MVRSSEASSANFQSVASSGLISKVAGSRCTSMSHAWWAMISPVRWLLKYMSMLGTASVKLMRSVSAPFWAKADGAAATPRAAVVERSVERRVIFKEGLLFDGSNLGRCAVMRQASRQPLFSDGRSRHDRQAHQESARRCARRAQGVEG